MPRGGRREGAGRKSEYREPVKNILLGLPLSVLEELDEFATERGLSRPKAIVALLKLIKEIPNPKRDSPYLESSSALLKELKALKADRVNAKMRKN